MAQWMVSKGARNLVLLSRSGLQDNNKLISFVEELQRSGVDVMCPQCDIADAASLQAVIQRCEASMPPIRGCIQAAMVLRVGSTFGG